MTTRSLHLQPLDLALSYAARGWPAFPCRAKEEVDDHTGEILSPKTPYTSNGLRGASKNERIIREWWRRTPDAMVGVPTGRAIGAWVLDLDRKPGVGDGHDWLADMEAAHGALPETARAKTMGGGTHIFFSNVEGIRNRGGLGVAVDVRGEGGYIVAPGSQAADGRQYEWLSDAPIADAPDWLLQLVLPPVHTPTRHDYHYERGTNEVYIERAVESELNALANATQGGRGYQLNASAFSLGTMVGAGALSRTDAEAGLYDAARACGVLAKDGERETWAKIRRGLEAGMRQPREIPEPSHGNDNTRLVDISRMIANGLAKAKNKPEAGSADVESSPQSDEVSEESIQTSDIASRPPANDNMPPFYATPFKWIDPATLPRREFAFGTHYIRKYVSVTVSPGGLGKTSNSIVEALAMASGKPLTGIKPPQRLKVWLFNAEDPRDEMERRIMAACIHYNLKPEDIEGYLFLDTGREQELVVMHEDRKTGLKINEPVVESVVEQIQRLGIDVKIVDPFVSTHRVNENDNGAIDKVAKLWAQIADYTNCAVDVVHHLRKVADREATVEDARGAVSLIGAARSVRVLNRMSDEQATKAGLEKDDRFSYFWIGQGKANLTKMDNSQHWRKLESVPLGNGSGLTKPQDHAGVVTEWKWPSKDEIAEAVPEAVKADVLVKLANQSCRESDQSSDWAGYVLATALGIPIETGRAMTPEKRKVKTILDSWIENGILAVVNETDPKHIGRSIKYVRPA
ncbi:MAG: ATPase [Mesorhizobium sp.]|nr:MAG: ATPase [Mesorhizobium sp.]